jgi:hypothetical protein
MDVFDEELLPLGKRFVDLFERAVVAFEKLASAITEEIDTEGQALGPAVAAQILIGGKMGSATVTPISDSQPTPVAVIGIDAALVLGAALAAGASIKITVDNTAVATFVQDASPLPQNTTLASGAAGPQVPSMISGVLQPALPVLANTPANVSYDITNADGTDGGSGSAAFQLVAGTEVTQSIVFGAPIAAAAGARGARPAASKVTRHT